MTVLPPRISDPTMAPRPKDWAQLGSMVQRAARRAMAIYLVEAAAQTAVVSIDDEPPITRSRLP